MEKKEVFIVIGIYKDRSTPLVVFFDVEGVYNSREKAHAHMHMRRKAQKANIDDMQGDPVAGAQAKEFADKYQIVSSIVK